LADMAGGVVRCVALAGCGAAAARLRRRAGAARRSAQRRALPAAVGPLSRLVVSKW